MAYPESHDQDDYSITRRYSRNTANTSEIEDTPTTRLLGEYLGNPYPRASDSPFTGTASETSAIASCEIDARDELEDYPRGYEENQTEFSYGSFTGWVGLPRIPPYEDIIRIPQSTYRHCGQSYNNTAGETIIEAATRMQLLDLLNGVSTNYLGDSGHRTNQSANASNGFNTSVWITSLPPDLNHKMLLDNVRNCGKIYATVVNRPGQGHTTSASKLIFFDVAGAENLLRQAREGRFIVNGYIPCVRHNRIQSEPQPLSTRSRVLHIEGPSHIVNQTYLADLFRRSGITWQDEEVLTLSHNEVTTMLEWRFGSYRCQAASARNLIQYMKVQSRSTLRINYPPWHAVTVNFGIDPCAPSLIMQHVSAPPGFRMPSYQLH